ncbi:short chain dehydrogenase reductase family protein [Stylonychia lemnae]|uniref:Short chain dehydrogenase reductase family protein n=1 Tax=Stylonychia lemnae TaxID=5949 RepID=A0A078AV51_STYLE|nr:short chain dehydrogenase reductase family protein [Stylonychia lemnae]|eukprot:CDW85137.1 short chain dehydrogenase reductase family protein [Stylonychia lemnae]
MDCCYLLTQLIVILSLSIIAFALKQNVFTRRKQTIKEKNGQKYVIVITGAAQGLVQDIKQETGIKSIEFIKVDISDPTQLLITWNSIISTHKQVNLLINNAARAIGKRFCDMQFEQFKKTIEINYFSIMQLTKLFLDQKFLIESKEYGEYHLVNIISIAGHAASAQNSDYSGSKFALTGSFDAIRQGNKQISLSISKELVQDRPNVCLTNIYPYFISTGLFHGFDPKMKYIVPTLKPEYTANRIYDSIIQEKREVYIWWYICYLKMVFDYFPLSLKLWIVQFTTGDGMKSFVGRDQIGKKKQ